MLAETARAAIAAAAARFAFSETPRLDAELLMAHAMGTSREMLLLHRLDDPPPPGFAALADRRAACEPVAYITGSRAFWTIELAVESGVLIPRADSETLIASAIAHFGDDAPGRILDLGTGPGTLLLAALAEWPGATGLGVDVSAKALALARRNADALGLAGRASFAEGDWASGIDARFDLILCNPPYIAVGEAIGAEVAHEPAEALFAGADGLDAYRVIVPALPQLIASGGCACLEIGWTQAEAVTALVTDAGLRATVRRDLAGRPRCIRVTA